MAGIRFRVMGMSALAALVVACGSSGGVGDDDAAQPGEDAGNGDDVTVDVTQPPNDSGQPQDSTTPPTNDATLDVNFGDAVWTADSSGGGTDGSQETGTGCAPDGILCNGNVAETCQNGQLSTKTCSGATPVCADGYGCVVCDPGSGTCSGSTASLCKSDGSGYTTSNCDSQLGLACQGGVCTGDCANIGQSYIGCEYYAATMLNDQLDQGTFPFAISVANTTSKAATVTISGPQTTGGPFTIGANSIQSITLPWESSISNTTGTLKQTGGAYHIKSTEPVTVYQFNARDYQINVTCASDLSSPPCHSFTNDASLLIPVNALTGNYYVVTHPDWNASADGYTSQHLPGLITVVATANNTSVQFTPNGSVSAGAGISATGTSTVTLNQGDVLQINSTANATSGSYGTDPSGSKIVASQPVEVFGGADCTNIPNAVQACDHIEEINFPLETLAKSYLVVPPTLTNILTNKKASHFVRMVGTVNATTLSYTPSVTGAPSSLNAGQVAMFETSTPFQVAASSPIIVGMYMEGASNYCTPTQTQTCAQYGDPAMTVAVGTSQFRDNYTFTAPSNYVQNWATVIAPTGNTVTIDTTTIAAASFTAIGTSGYGYYHYQICNGNCGNASANHTATSSGPFGIQVYGYGSYTSYWYPGGLNLTR